MTVIGIDLGGSGSRLAVAGDNTVGEATGPAFAVIDGRADHADVVRLLARSLPPIDEPVTAVAVSAAGLVSLGDPHLILSAVVSAWPDAAVIVASDAVGALIGAWGESGGAVVAAGTGVVALATNFADVWARSDGWGHVLGDDGGAAWIGGRGMSAALRALDRRPNASPALLDSLREWFGDPLKLPDAVRSSPNPATMLASFAPRVTAEARRGDTVAGAIVGAAARELADTGLSVLRANVPQRLALVGGLSSEQAIAEGFVARVRETRRELEISVNPGTPLDGALVLAHLAPQGAPVAHPPYLVRFPS